MAAATTPGAGGPTFGSRGRVRGAKRYAGSTFPERGLVTRCWNEPSLAPPTQDTTTVIEWHREGVALLINLSTYELPDKPVSFERLATVPLLAPSAGRLADFLRRWFGPEYRSTLNVVADIDALNYGLALLDSHLLRGCLMTTEAVARAAIDGRLQGGSNLRMLELGSGFPTPLELVTGIFARKSEREHYAEDHPLNLLWREFEREASARSSTYARMPSD